MDIDELIKYATLLDFIYSDQFYKLPDDIQAIIRDYTEELGEKEI